MSALNPALLERYRKPRRNKTRTPYVGTVPGVILSSGRLSAPLEYARGAFFSVAAPSLSLGDALGQLLAAAAHIRAAAPDRDRPGAPGRAGPRQTGAVPSGAQGRPSRQGRLLMPTTLGLVRTPQCERPRLLKGGLNRTLAAAALASKPIGAAAVSVNLRSNSQASSAMKAGTAQSSGTAQTSSCFARAGTGRRRASKVSVPCACRGGDDPAAVIRTPAEGVGRDSRRLGLRID